MVQDELKIAFIDSLFLTLLLTIPYKYSAPDGQPETDFCSSKGWVARSDSDP